MKYVDGFVTPVPKAKLDEYRQMSETAGKVWREHGALEFIEAVADDVPPGKLTSFPQAVQLKDDETVFFSYVVYDSREKRDEVMKKVMEDPRIKEQMDPAKLPFDGKRMFYGGFREMVHV